MRCLRLDFIFTVKGQADDEVIRDFHRALAKGLINKHGVDVMRKVVDFIKVEIKEET